MEMEKAKSAAIASKAPQNLVTTTAFQAKGKHELFKMYYGLLTSSINVDNRARDEGKEYEGVVWVKCLINLLPLL